MLNDVTIAESTTQDLSSHHSISRRISPSPGFEQGKTGGMVKFRVAELKKITGNFSESHLIGEGDFCKVYRGKLKDGNVLATNRTRKFILHVLYFLCLEF
uniref:Protein kinase domain-containing protein n=1 Tax=Physcomitrium patens TaxID=3218 RepID=A0A2K1LAD9_PHYPA|nr:hypothetical protein PHYPA_001413 [Physcomitrium patens]